MKTTRRFTLAAILAFATIPMVDAQTTNSWISVGAGFWESAGNWSAGVPSNNQALVQITNATSKAAIIRAATTNSPGTMTISNLLVSAPVGTLNEVQLTTTGTNVPLRILNILSLTARTALTISNGAVQVERVSGAGVALMDDGDILLNSPTARLIIGGGTNALTGPLDVGSSAGETGRVWVTDGLLVATNGNTAVGGGGAGQMTVSNGIVLVRQLTVGGSSGSQGTLTVAGGSNTVSISTGIGGGTGSTGVVWVTGGLFDSSTTIISGDGVARMTLSNGTLVARDLNLASTIGSRGTLTVAGGLLVMTNVGVATLAAGLVGSGEMTFSGGTGIVENIKVGGDYSAGSGSLYTTGTLWVTGGQLTVLGNSTGIDGGFRVGDDSPGWMTMSNGVVFATDFLVGFADNGTFTMVGGTNTVSGTLGVGVFPSSDGTVWLTGNSARLVVTNATTVIGRIGVGQLTVSNGTLLARNVIVASNSTARGTLTIAGGTSTIYSNLTIGSFTCAGTGTAVVAGGSLFVTNAAGNAALEVRSGSVTLNSGTLVIDQLILTNPCGRFVHTGGALSITTTNLPPGLDADGDGFLNGSDPDPLNPDDDGDGLPGDWEVTYGLDPLDATGVNGAAGDPDGDGLSNLAEYIGGTDPTVPSPNPSANSWDFSSSSIWEMNNRWSLNSRPSLSDPADWITNASTKTVTLASSANVNSLTITNLGVQGFGAGTNTLLVTTTNDLVILNHFAVGTNAFVIVSNSNLRVDGKLGGNFLIDGTVTNDGGSIVAMSNLTTTVIGDNSRGSLTMRAGKMLNRDVVVGHNSGATGTLTIAGGTNSIFSSLTLGTFGCTATGTVIVTGGSLFVTNAGATAVLEVRSGTLQLNSGALTIDNLVITNACASFTKTGGTLIYTTAMLNPTADFDGDGMNNGFEQTYGLDPFNPADAGGDPDGDGYTNLQEFNVGTNPTDAGSNPGINSWTNSASDKWEVGTNWLLTIPPASNQTVFVTNVTTKVVTIDATTTNTPATMTITNLTVAGPAGTINTLQLSNAGTNVPLRILNMATINSGGALLVTNSTVRVEAGALTVNAATDNASLTVLSNGTVAVVGPVTIGGGVNSTGLVTGASGLLVVTNNPALVGTDDPGLSNALRLVIDGSVVVTNGSSMSHVGITIGNLGSGSLTVYGGSMSNVGITIGKLGSGSLTVLGGSMLLSGPTVGFSGRGTFTMNGGTILALDTLDVAFTVNSTGAVWMTGGQLTITNNSTSWIVGNSGVGQMTVSNGTWLTRLGHVGLQSGSQGTLTIAGGTNALSADLFIATAGFATGAVWVTGGQLSNRSAFVGFGGVGQMTLSNGTWLAQRVIVASNALAQGTLTIAGGTSSVFSNLIIGSFPCTPTGTVIIAGGSLLVTNATTTAVLEIRTGSLILNSGVLTIDKLVMTNSCASFSKTGGTLVYGTAVLDPARDDDGDGLPNGWEESFGLDPLDGTGVNGAAGDPDGDGFTNQQEFQAGTNPTNSASAFRITSITQVSSTNILITWMTGVGKTNALEKVAGGMGSYTNNFDTLFVVTNTVGTTTNYLDVGAIGSNPARYYRVRLIP